ncbi:MAG: hypothetical protein AAGE94_23405, partial [Acidobacteriota bacterium]
GPPYLVCGGGRRGQEHHHQTNRCQQGLHDHSTIDRTMVRSIAMTLLADELRSILPTYRPDVFPHSLYFDQLHW